MAALTQDRNTPEKVEARLRVFGVAAGTIIRAGALVVLDGGTLKPGSTALGLVAVGRAERSADNSAGGAGDMTVPVKRGTFRFANSAAPDALSAADIGQTAFIVDDQTVAKTNGAGTRSAAGTVYDVDPLGVWIEI